MEQKGISICILVERGFKLVLQKFLLKGSQVKKAELYGSKEERIAQCKANKYPPETGLYVSTKQPVGMRFIVEDVFVDEDFFLVQLIDEVNADDTGAVSDELDSEEWFALVDRYGLVKSKYEV